MPPDSQVNEFIQYIPSHDSPMEVIIQGRHDRQDLKGEPPDSRVEEFIQGIPVEEIIQDRQHATGEISRDLDRA